MSQGGAKLICMLRTGCLRRMLCCMAPRSFQSEYQSMNWGRWPWPTQWHHLSSENTLHASAHYNTESVISPHILRVHFSEISKFNCIPHSVKLRIAAKNRCTYPQVSAACTRKRTTLGRGSSRKSHRHVTPEHCRATASHQRAAPAVVSCKYIGLMQNTAARLTALEHRIEVPVLNKFIAILARLVLSAALRCEQVLPLLAHIDQIHVHQKL